MTIAEGTLIWTPPRELIENSHMTAYMGWLRDRRGLSFSTYDQLWQWSVSDIEAFWESIWDYFPIRCDAPYDRMLDNPQMPGARWLTGARLNYVEQLLVHEETFPDAVAMHCYSEARPYHRYSWSALGNRVRVLASWLRARGVSPGDRVVAYMPTAPETVIAMLATIAIGAVWSSAAPEFGHRTVVDRFAQIRPTFAFIADGYRFAGKDFDRRSVAKEIAASLPTLREIIWLPLLREASDTPDFGLPVTQFSDAVSGPSVDRTDFAFERVAADHPLWVLFSSGTTGLPKTLVHGHGGMILEHLKANALHLDLKPGSCRFFYTTTGWMMWNGLISSFIAGSSIVLYDGSPFHPAKDQLWKIAAEAGVTNFGASPAFVAGMQKDNIRPGELFDLSRLGSVFMSGAPASPETFEWFYAAVKKDLWVTSQSGGTEFCSGLVGSVPLLPVYAGEIQARSLGVAVEAWNSAGNAVINEVGELVVTKPMPSMPLGLWNDEGDRRYRETYFEAFAGVWTHGDFIKINERGGCYIYGRSDATLNRHGVRIGSAEIYETVESVEGVRDSLIVCVELSDGGFYMPLFVQMHDGHDLDARTKEAVVSRLRAERSPRHVPDEIIPVPAIPYTLSMKKMEVPVRRLLLGKPAEQSFQADALADPKAMDWYLDFARSRAANKHLGAAAGTNSG